MLETGIVKMPQCQAINCSNKQGKGGKSFFQIPHPQKSKAHRALCKKWIELLRNDKLSIETFVNNKSRVVCEDHFPPESFGGTHTTALDLVQSHRDRWVNYLAPLTPPMNIRAQNYNQ